MDSWRELEALFLETALRPAEHPWPAVWRMLVDHPWYQKRLATSAQRVVREGAPVDWLEDIRQDAMLLLAEHLRRSPDLHYSRTRGADRFAGWMTSIILNDCRQAARRMRRWSSRTERLGMRDLPAAERMDLETRIDLSLALDSLDDPQRTILHLRSKNMTLEEISEQLGLSVSSVYRALQKGLEELQRVWSGG